MRGIFPCIHQGEVKEEGGEEGRGLEEIITPLSNQEEVIWQGQGAPVDISPSMKHKQPPRIRLAVERKVRETEYCDNYRPRQQTHTHTTHVKPHTPICVFLFLFRHPGFDL